VLTRNSRQRRAIALGHPLGGLERGDETLLYHMRDKGIRYGCKRCARAWPGQRDIVEFVVTVPTDQPGGAGRPGGDVTGLRSTGGRMPVNAITSAVSIGLRDARKKRSRPRRAAVVVTGAAQRARSDSSDPRRETCTTDHASGVSPVT